MVLGTSWESNGIVLHFCYCCIKKKKMETALMKGDHSKELNMIYNVI